MKLIIDRAKWLRGEGADKSYLVRDSDQKMCCLGFYGCSLGIDPSAMNTERSPETKFWDKDSWLFSSSPNGAYSTDGERLMSINDMPGSDARREETIIALFANHDVQVEFVGE